jgi:hypothetical protein
MRMNKMTKHEYKTNGTCSRKIIFELDDEGKVHNVVFEGGCHGNLHPDPYAG